MSHRNVIDCPVAVARAYEGRQRARDDRVGVCDVADARERGARDARDARVSRDASANAMADVDACDENALWRAIAGGITPDRAHRDVVDDAYEPFVAFARESEGGEGANARDSREGTDARKPSARARSARSEVKVATLSAPSAVAVMRFGAVDVGDSAVEELEIVNDTALAQVCLNA
jgi:hypothetical protein